MPEKNVSYVFNDTETTGLNINFSQIIQIGSILTSENFDQIDFNNLIFIVHYLFNIVLVQSSIEINPSLLLILGSHLINFFTFDCAQSFAMLSGISP